MPVFECLFMAFFWRDTSLPSLLRHIGAQWIAIYALCTLPTPVFIDIVAISFHSVTVSCQQDLHYWCFRFQLFFLIKFITVKIPFSLCTSNWQGFLPFFGKGVTDRPRPERTWLIKRKKRIEINIQSKYLGGVVSIF